MNSLSAGVLSILGMAAVAMVGCAPVPAERVADAPPADPRSVDKKSVNYVNPYPVNSYEHFVASREYPAVLKEYANESLLNQASGKEKFVVICLPEQRGRFYVDGQVALDWPVSTGVPGHSTPTGAFKVLSKELSHHSSRYGVFRDAEGRVVNGNADILKESAPEGGSFVPSPMPYWQRLTGDGVGIHIGKVKAGRRLSHGCIRSPRSAAVKLYKATSIGTPVYITNSVEDFKTGAVALADRRRVYKPAPSPARRKSPAAPSAQEAAPSEQTPQQAAPVKTSPEAVAPLSVQESPL